MRPQPSRSALFGALHEPQGTEVSRLHDGWRRGVLQISPPFYMDGGGYYTNIPPIYLDGHTSRSQVSHVKVAVKAP